MARAEHEGDHERIAARSSEHKTWHLKKGTSQEGYKQLVLAFQRWREWYPVYLLEALKNPKSEVGKALLNEMGLTRLAHPEAVALYRGIKGTKEAPGRPLQSWTDSRKQASWWAGERGKVLSRTFTPDKLVASYKSNGNVSRAEREFIVRNW
jgi:hypothetical protein